MASLDAAGSSQDTLGRLGDPCVMVAFGAGADLTKRKLLPAIFRTMRQVREAPSRRFNFSAGKAASGARRFKGQPCINARLPRVQPG